MPGAHINSDQKLHFAKTCTRLKKFVRLQKRRSRWDLEKLYVQRKRLQDNLEEKLCAIECDSGNVEVQLKNIKECVLDTISDLVGKVEDRASKPWITKEMISKIYERRKWKNINFEEGKKKYLSLRNEL